MYVGQTRITIRLNEYLKYIEHNKMDQLSVAKPVSSSGHNITIEKLFLVKECWVNKMLDALTTYIKTLAGCSTTSNDNLTFLKSF